MPRPGPRPYECVRRAWHSDRHQPMRGSIIQQIFRVVHESHTAGTKKNREWQEKLPLVVLRSEEIMYSKANSEAEYMDPDTLWDRINDAINTIIRKDDTMETGDLLPPCVEAALNLGCVPVRATRSQRNSNPRSYLSPRAQDSGAIPPTGDAAHARNLNLPNIDRPMLMAQTQVNRNVMQTYNNNACASGNFASSGEKFPLLRNNQFVASGSKASMGVGSVYPLYHGVHSQPEVSLSGIHNLKHSNTIIVGTPIYHAISEPPDKDCLQELFRDHGSENPSNKIPQSDFRINHENEPERMKFDLSLRLGPLSEPCSRKGETSTSNNHEVGPSNYQERSPQCKEISFFPVASTANEPLDQRGWNFEGEGQNVEAAIRKRKVVPDIDLNDSQVFWQLESSSNQMKRRGL